MARTKKAARATTPGVALLAPFLTDKTEHYLDRIEKMLAPDVPGLKMHTGMVFGEQSKYVTWTIPESFESIELLQISDVQFGHVMCKYERVIEYRDWVLAEPNRFMLWTGDNVDAWAMHSPGSPFEQLGNPQSQVYKFVEAWAPARHRILGYVGGNHERRGIPAFGDLGVMLAMLLRVPYSGGRQMIDIRFGLHHPFKISLWHGVGGARTKGTVAQTLDRFMQKGDSQLYLMGHLHQPMIIPGWKEVRDGQQIRLQKIMGGVASSFLDLWNTYGEVAGFSASDVLMPRAVLERGGGWELTLR